MNYTFYIRIFLIALIMLCTDSIRNKILGQSSIDNIMTMRSQADTLTKSGDLSGALEYLESAYQLSIEANHDSLAAAILTDMAEPLAKSGDYETAISNCLKAADLYQELNIPNGTAEVYYLMANIFLYMGDIDQGVSYLEKAIDLFREVGNQGYEASAMSNLAMVFNKQNKLDQAEAFIRKAILIKTELKDTLDLVRMQMNLAENLFMQNKTVEALDHMESVAWPILRDQPFTHEKIAFYQIQGVLLKKLNKFQAAESAYIKALNYAQSYHFPYLESEILKNLASFYQDANQFENAFTYYIRANTINDSLNNIDKQKEIQALRESFEASEREREIKLLKKEESISQLKIRLLLVSIVLVAALLGGGIFIYRKKRDLETLKAQQLQTELDLKNQQLTARALEMVRKNDFLSNLSEEISSENLNQQKILREIKMHYQMESEWDQFQFAFNKVHIGFTETLKASYSELTANELRHCCLLKLGLSIKETASLLGITPASVKVGRNRIKKKIVLTGDQNLQDFLIDIK